MLVGRIGMTGRGKRDMQIEENIPSNVHVMLEGVVVSGMMKAIEICENSVNVYIKSTNSQQRLYICSANANRMWNPPSHVDDHYCI